MSSIEILTISKPSDMNRVPMGSAINPSSNSLHPLNEDDIEAQMYPMTPAPAYSPDQAPVYNSHQTSPDYPLWAQTFDPERAFPTRLPRPLPPVYSSFPSTHISDTRQSRAISEATVLDLLQEHSIIDISSNDFNRLVNLPSREEREAYLSLMQDGWDFSGFDGMTFQRLAGHVFALDAVSREVYLLHLEDEGMMRKDPNRRRRAQTIATNAVSTRFSTQAQAEVGNPIRQRLRASGRCVCLCMCLFLFVIFLVGSLCALRYYLHVLRVGRHHAKPASSMKLALIPASSTTM
jgi:hypothetical protein